VLQKAGGKGGERNPTFRQMLGHFFFAGNHSSRLPIRCFCGGFSKQGIEVRVRIDLEQQNADCHFIESLIAPLDGLSWIGIASMIERIVK
jgi:hypothetical protein